MKSIGYLLFSIFLSFTSYCTGYSQNQLIQPRHIEVSKINPSYFSFSDGSPYIPVGINLINPSRRNHEQPDSAFYEIEQWMKNLSENGGNYIRIWLSQSFWDMEDKVAGKYSDEKVKRIDRFIEMARKYKLRVKMTLEHFRSVTLEENPQRWATKFVYHSSNGGPLDSIRQYLVSSEGQQLFLDKVDFYQKSYGIMQSLGSFDNENVRPIYKRLMLLPGNEIAQVHRYLDLGAKMEVCRAPMDIICSSAVEELLSYQMRKPVILAETGAVEPQHAGPSK